MTNQGTIPANLFYKLAKRLDLKLYDFSETVYIDKYTAITYKCVKHNHLISTLPDYLLIAKDVCIHCRNEKKGAVWIDKVTKKFKGFYKYDKVQYKSIVEPVIITCPEHGDFEQRPEVHQRGVIGCPTCARDKYRLSTELFIKKATKIFGKRFGYSKAVFTRTADPIIITCREHGDWVTRAASHLAGYNCPDCSIDASRSTVENFLTKAREVHGNSYDYSEVRFVHTKSHVNIRCRKHGIFKVTPNTHIYNRSGCPRCRQSYGEKLIRNYLDSLGVKVFQEYTIPGYRYRMDFYIPEWNVFIEHHGVQHYRPVKRFGGMDALKRTQANDEHKKRIAEDLGIRLIVTNCEHLDDGVLIDTLEELLGLQ